MEDKTDDMIKAEELRIGNKFTGIGGIQTCLSIIDYTDRGDWNGQEAQPGYEHLILVKENGNQYKPFEIEPIPITPETLERSGFDLQQNWLWQIKYNTSKYLSFRYITMDKAFSDNPQKLQQPFLRWDGKVDVYHVHHLQNIFFVLCGHELRINL